MKFEKEIKTAVRNTFSKEFRDDLGTFYDFFKYYFKPLYFKRYVPILIYQMGKVGSTTILKSLRDYGVNPVYHIHSMNIQNIKMKKEEFKDKGPPYGTPPKHLDKYKKLRPILKENRSVKIISLVREPIWRNISGFFQNLPKYISKEKRRKDLSYLEKIFFRDYDRHDRPEKWFDREIKEVIGMEAQ